MSPMHSKATTIIITKNLCLQSEIDFLVQKNKNKKLPRKLREIVGASFLPGILATYWCLLYNDVLINPHQIDTKYRDSSQRIPPQQRFRKKSVWVSQKS